MTRRSATLPHMWRILAPLCLVGCGTLLGLDDEGEGDDDTSSSGGASSSSGSSGLASSTSGSSGVGGPCPDALFCDDFNDGELNPSWDLNLSASVTHRIDQGGPDRSLALRLTAVQGAFFHLDGPLELDKRPIRWSFDARPEQLHSAGTAVWQLFEWGSLTLQWSRVEGGPLRVRVKGGAEVSANMELDEGWHHFDLEAGAITNTTRAATLSVDGQPYSLGAVDARASTATFRVGLTGSGSQEDMAIVWLDNVLVTQLD